MDKETVGLLLLSMVHLFENILDSRISGDITFGEIVDEEESATFSSVTYEIKVGLLRGALVTIGMGGQGCTSHFDIKPGENSTCHFEPVLFQIDHYSSDKEIDDIHIG